MAAIVAPGIARYAVEGRYSGRQVINILDFKIDTTGSSESRSDAVEDQAKRILDAWDNHILEWVVADNYTALNVSWIDIDSLTGSTGEISSTATHSWPKAGAGAGSAMPGSVAMRVNKRTNAGRGSKQGRMYLAGVTEGMTTDEEPNLLSASVVTNTNAVMATFLSEITAEIELPGVTDWTSQLHVVHTLDGAFTNSTEVIGLELDGTLSTQRRRLR